MRLIIIIFTALLILVPKVSPAQDAQDMMSSLPAVKLPTGTQFDYPRALKNYKDVTAGQKDVKNLSEQERNELFLLMNAMHPSPPPGASEECKTAWQDAEESKERIISYSADLRRCLENGAFRDDCSGKFRDVKDRYERYERAVSTIRSSCPD